MNVLHNKSARFARGSLACPYTRGIPSDRVALLIEAATALQNVGTPAHRLEETLEVTAKALDVDLHLFSTPTAVQFSVLRPLRLTRLLRVDTGEPDLARLMAVDGVLEAVRSGRLSPRAARDAIARVKAAPPLFDGAVTVAAYATTCAGASVFFGAGQHEFVASGLVGLAIGAASRMAGRPEASRLMAPASAFVAAAAAGALNLVWPLNASLVTISALIVLVPGMTTTTAMTELATRHLASGASRLAGALSDFLIIAFGVAMGRALVSALAGELALDVDSATLPVWAGPLSLALAPLAFAILFRVPTTQWAWVLIGSAAGLVGSAWGASFMGPTQGAFLGALVVGVIANAYARGLSRPASTIALPGLLMLVPGSLGYRAMGLLMARDVEAGLLAAVDTAVVAVALVAGSLAANAVLSPRRGL